VRDSPVGGAGSGAEDRDATVGPVCRRLVPALVRHRAPILWGALLLTLVGGWFSARLYSDLKSDLEELLPDGAPSVVAARSVAPRLRSVVHLSIVFEGKDPDGLERLADDLAARLRALPPGLVATVEYRTDEAEAFVRRFGGFYLSVEDLHAIQGRIDRRIAWERRKANPLLDIVGDDDEVAPAPPLDFKDMEVKYGGAGGGFGRFRKGYFQTRDGGLLVLLVRAPEASTGYPANRALLSAVERELGALHPERYDPAIRVGFDGEVATLVEEQQALVEDLALSTAVVVALVLAALWVFFRRRRAILAISGALAVGCALTFGVSYFLVGYLNANTAFLGSIVVGNGINVSIIFVARYLEERGRGRPLELAIERAWSGTLAATFVASFGAALAYLSLVVTDFRGFSQFGLIGGLGMALCWVVAYLLLPPLIAALEPFGGRPVASGRRSVVGQVAAGLVSRHGPAIRVLSVVLLAGAVVAVLRYRGDIIEYDLSKLRSARGMKSGSQYWGAKVDEVFKEYLTPTVIRAETPGELGKVVEALEAERKNLGDRDPIREVRTIESLVPPDQAAKLPLLRHLRDTLTDARLARLEGEKRELAERMRPPADLRPIRLQDVPESVRLALVEKDGSSGRIALVFPKKVGTLDPRELHEFAKLIRDAIARSGVRAQAVGQSLLFEDISTAIIRDGPRATALALALVCLIVVATFRRFRPSAAVLLGLLLGVAWLVGVGAAARVRLNFLNFVVLPITFGIGVDYAVNIVQRWRLEGMGSLDRVLRETGGAVGLCSLTTIIGYSSLLVADNRALQGFGLLASLGEVTCITAALVALPAWLQKRSNGAP